MSLSFSLAKDGKWVYETNITHNLAPMARKAGLYKPLWDSEGKKAKTIIKDLRTGIDSMIENKRELEKLEPANGWGSFDGLLTNAVEALTVCGEYPEFKVVVHK